MAAGWRVSLALLLATCATRCGAGSGCGFIQTPAPLLWGSLGCRQVCLGPPRDLVAAPMLSGISMKMRGAGEGQGDTQSHTTEELEGRIGVKFNDISLLKKACTHRSMVEGIDSNERLEFLGDAVLGMVVAEQLFRENSSFREGRLTALRKEVVSRKALARIGRDQGLGPYLRISTAEASTGGRNKENALADFVESIIGAVYVDQGLEAARKLISNWLGDMMIEAAESPEGSDFKTRLQEDMRRLRIGQPSYTVTRSGPVHNSRFTAHMLSDAGQRLGWGEGKSKKEAEQAAAEYSLRLIGEMTEDEMARFRAQRKGQLADAQITC